MQTRCPHCHDALEISDDDPLKPLECPSCGSSFSLISGDPTIPRDARGGKIVGRFKLIETIGMGRFGTVWEARDTELDRKVAVKIPRKDQLDSTESEQFFREARAAAQLKHPNIVGIHEVGRDGETIYIVSDYIQGANLSEWLTGRRLSPREVGELCVKIADALQHAHDSGVIHRDLKPSNIMLDLDREPHIMDFGLAKRETGEITMTVEGQVLGTPAYMSPEQARGEGHKADRRTDLYSLGVILYELLTGERPFRGEPRMLIVQLLTVEPPAPRKLNNRIPRDLETLCLKCMEKEPSRRYQTAREISEELGRYLRGEPILTRPVGGAERLSRWIRRNPLVASLAISIALLLVAIAVSSSVAAVRIAAARDDATRNADAERLAREKADLALKRAEEQRAAAVANLARAQQAEKAAQLAETEALQVADFMVGLFEGSDPLAFAGYRFGAPDSGADVTAREMLDRGAKQIAAELKNQPLIQATMMNTIGNVYTCLGQLKVGIPYLEEALEIRREHLDARDPDLAESLHNLGLLRFVQGRYDEAERMLREAIEIRGATFGAEASPTVLSEFMLAWVLLETEFTGEVEQLLRNVVAVRSGSDEGDPRDEAYAYAGLGLVLAHKGDNWNALLNVRKALNILQRKNDQAVSIFATAIEGIVLAQLGNSVEAVRKFQEALEKAPEVVGEIHPVINHLQISLATYLVDEDRLDAAEAVYRDALQRGMKTFGRQPRVAETMIELAVLLRNQRRFAEAEELFRDALRIDREILGDNHPNVAHILNGLGALLYCQGEYAEAELCHREALGILSNRLGDDNPQKAFGLHALAAVRRLEGDHAEAEQLYAQSERMLRQAIEERDFQSRVRTAAGNIVSFGSLLRDRKQYKAAEIAFRQSLEFCRATMPANDWRLARLQSELGECLTAQKQFEEAEPLLLAGHRNIESKFTGGHQRTREALERIVRLYEDWDKPDKARGFRNKSEPRPPVKAPLPTGLADR